MGPLYHLRSLLLLATFTAAAGFHATAPLLQPRAVPVALRRPAPQLSAAVAAASDEARPQPARAALAALLQARGQHREALSLLCIQRKGLREAVARHGGEAEGGGYADGAGGGNVAAELAYTCGRLALSAFAVRREGLAMASLREAARLRLIGTGGMGDGAAAADGGGRDGGSSVASVEALERWIEHAQTLPIDLARALGSKQSPGWTGSVSSRRAAAAAATPASGENACGGGGHDHSRIPLCV